MGLSQDAQQQGRGGQQGVWLSCNILRDKMAHAGAVQTSRSGEGVSGSQGSTSLAVHLGRERCKERCRRVPHKTQLSECNAHIESRTHLEAPEVLHTRANHGGP